MVKEEHLTKFQEKVDRIARNDLTLTDQSWRDGTSAQFIGYGIDDENTVQLAAALKGNTTLNNLLLWDNFIGDQGCETLCEALKHNECLVHLSLSFNRITTRGMVALCDLIAIHPTLTEIHVSNNKIGDEGALLLCTALQRNTRVTELWIKGCSVTDEGLDALTDALADCPDLSNFLIESNDFSSAAVANCALTLPKARISTSLPSKDVEAAKKMLLEALPPK
eukprot:m.249075 g.249075  ORF g.249075 m.249075 type:complete len:223 (-) comp19083_c0_seq2:35-703(-)